VRFLLVVPPLVGHVAPLRGVAAALTADGHEVAWCGPEPMTTTLIGGAQTGDPSVFAAGDSEAFAVEKRPTGLRGFAALRQLWTNYLLPLADEMISGVDAAVSAFEPDVLVVDQQAFAGALVAMRRDVPWATSASTSTELADPFAAMPKIASWIDGLQYELRARHDVVGGDLRFSPHLVLTYTTTELAGEPAPRFKGTVRYVGPAPVPPATAAFPWHLLDGRPLVLVTLGTANPELGTPFLAGCVEALEHLPHLQGVVVDPTGELVADHVVLARRVPQVELLRKAAAVVCHGGHNTVCEALRDGVPLIVAPIRDDQSMLAEQVVAAGAGVRLRFDRADPLDIRHAIDAVLTSPAYAASAERIRASFDVAGGATAAAQHLIALATATARHHAGRTT